MLSFLTIGTILGLSAGIAPGPLMALVISETLRHDMKAGIRVALAPILTDLPIIILTLFVLSKLAAFHAVLGIISIIGAFFIIYLGIGNIAVKELRVGSGTDSPRSLQKGILANVLSPHPYLFWFSVGGPLLLKAYSTSLTSALAFIVSFYFLLVGSKIFLAVLAGKSRSFLSGNIYTFAMRTLGIILILLGGLILMEGLQLLGFPA